MLQLLVANVSRDPGKLPDADRSKIVALLPAEAPPPRVAIAVGDACTGALQALDEARCVVDGGQREQQMNMIAHDPHLHDARAVPLRLGEKEWAEKAGEDFIDQRQARPGGPREVS